MNKLCDDIFQQLLGFGEKSIRKSYYPQLQSKLEELRVEKERYKRIFSDALTGIIQADLDGNIVVANNSIVTIFGYETIKKFTQTINLRKNFFCDERDKVLFFTHLEHKGKIEYFETKVLKEDGTTVEIAINGVYQTIENREIIECFIQDISSQKQAQFEVDKLTKQITNLYKYTQNISIIMTALDGTIKIFNTGAEKILGYSAEEMIDKKTPMTFHLLDEVEEYNRELELEFGVTLSGFEGFLYTGKMDQFKERIWTYVRKGGEHRLVKLMVTGIYDDDGELQNLVGYATDITELKQKSDQLEDLNKELTLHKNTLEKTVEERTKKLEQSIDDLKRTHKYLVESEKMASLGGLVAGVAHEINTPIGIGITASTFLDSKTKEITKKLESGSIKKRELIAYINSATESSAIIFKNMERAADLIQSFKQVAVDQSNEDFRKFNLKGYIEEVVKSLHPKIKRKNLELKLIGDSDIEIESFPGAFSQVITNLIINSIVHGFEDMSSGEIIIDLKREKTQLNIGYKDSGKGIGKDVKERIFDPFYTTKRGKGGTGLGMNIVYNIITQKLKGNIECLDSDGAQFLITIPLNS